MIEVIITIPDEQCNNMIKWCCENLTHWKTLDVEVDDDNDGRIAVPLLSRTNKEWKEFLKEDEIIGYPGRVCNCKLKMRESDAIKFKLIWSQR